MQTSSIRQIQSSPPTVPWRRRMPSVNQPQACSYTIQGIVRSIRIRRDRVRHCNTSVLFTPFVFKVPWQRGQNNRHSSTWRNNTPQNCPPQVRVGSNDNCGRVMGGCVKQVKTCHEKRFYQTLQALRFSRTRDQRPNNARSVTLEM